jgi:hypothetical protein
MSVSERVVTLYVVPFTWASTLSIPNWILSTVEPTGIVVEARVYVIFTSENRLTVPDASTGSYSVVSFG